MKKALLVVGMHRSGTSALAGALSILGLDLGADLLPAKSGENEFGFFELKEVVSFHDSLLLSGGRTWDLPAPMTAGWLDRFATRSRKAELARILESNFADSDLWAVKDPRLCVLLPLWLEVLANLSVDVAIVHIARQPEAVVASLARRNGFSSEKSGYLWLDHNLRAERDSRGIRRAFISYEDLLDGKMATLDGLSDQLGLSWPDSSDRTADAVERFLNPDLDHEKDSSPGNVGEYGRWTEIVTTLAKLLRDLPQRGDGGDTLQAFETLRQQQDGLLSGIDPNLLSHCSDLVLGQGGLRELQDSTKAAKIDLQRAAAHTKKIEGTLEGTVKEERQVKKHLASLEKDLTAQSHQVEKVDAWARSLESELDKRVELIRQLEGEIRKQADSLVGLERALDDADRYTRILLREIDELQNHQKEHTRHSRNLEQQVDTLQNHQEEHAEYSRNLERQVDTLQNHQEEQAEYSRSLEQQIETFKTRQKEQAEYSRSLEQQVDTLQNHQEEQAEYSRSLEQQIETFKTRQEEQAQHSRTLEQEMEKHLELQGNLADHIRSLEQEIERHRIHQKELASWAQDLAARLVERRDPATDAVSSAEPPREGGSELP